MPLVEINKTEIFYITVGQGLPCMVMHGGLGLDHSYLHPSLDPLSDLFQLIYYDHRGNGRSGRPPIETLTHEQFVNDAGRLREYLGFDKVVVMGHSYGGFIALEYALNFPEQVISLILIDTAAAYNYSKEIRANLKQKQPSNEMLTSMRAPNPSSNTDLKRMFHLVLPLYFHKFDAVLARRLFEDTFWSASAAARSELLLRKYNLISRLKEIRIPTLIIVGQHDFICPPSQAKLLNQFIENSEVVVFRESGHFPHIEEPEAFFQTVRNWSKKKALDK